MSNRKRGDYLEHQTRAALEHYRWVVVRAGGSLGPADLVALRDGNAPLLVQCKITGNGRRYPRVDPDERAALWETAEKAGARPIIATRYRGGWVALLALNGPSWTEYPTLDELHVPARPGKRGDPP
jgi:Holliday junction resolvase